MLRNQGKLIVILYWSYVILVEYFPVAIHSLEYV